MVTENMEQYKGVFIYAQQVDGEISPIAFELLGKAKDLAADLDLTETFIQMGIDELSVTPNQVLALRKKIREIQ